MLDGGTRISDFLSESVQDVITSLGAGPVIYYLLQFDGNVLTDVNITTCFSETNYPTRVLVWDSAVPPMNLTRRDIVLTGTTAGTQNLTMVSRLSLFNTTVTS